MQIQKKCQHFTHTALAAALVLTYGSANALPTGGVVIQGGAQIFSGNGQTDIILPKITAAVGKHIINWTGFNIAAGENVEFSAAPGASGTQYVLNRVSGPASQINGSILVNNFSSAPSGLNMHVFIMNPNGVIVGSGANVTQQGTSNVAPFIGNATLTLSNSSVTDAAFFGGTLPTGACTVTSGGCVIPAMPASALLGSSTSTTSTSLDSNASATLGPLASALPYLTSYLALFNAAQGVAFSQLQTYFAQNPGTAQYAANVIAQAAPQAVAQAQAGTNQILQQLNARGASVEFVQTTQGALQSAPTMVGNVMMAMSNSLANGDFAGLQDYIFSNSMSATVTDGVINLLP